MVMPAQMPPIDPQTAMQMAQMLAAKQQMAQQGQQGAMPEQSPWAQMGAQQDPNVGPMMAANGASPSPKPSPSPGIWELIQGLAQNDEQKRIEAAKKKPVKSNAGTDLSGGYNRASGLGSSFKK